MSKPGVPLPPGSVRENPEACPSGVRHVGGAKLNQALVRNVGTCRSDAKGDVEVDETTIPLRTKNEPVAGGQGRSPIGKIVVVGAVELKEGNKPGRIRLGVVPDYRGETLKGFIRVNVARGSHIWTDDNKSYYGLDGYGHTPRAVGKMAAHVIMPWIHRVFSNAKRWGLGVFHGFREKYWNRRHSYRSAFDRL